MSAEQPEDSNNLASSSVQQPSPRGNQPSEEEETPQKPVTFSYGVLMVRTRKLLSILDSLARYKIFARLGWVMLAITVLSAAVMIWLMIDSTYLVLTSSLAFKCAIGAAPASLCKAKNLTVGSPPPLQSYLLLPGINPFVPIVYGIVGIVVAVVIHEGTHGVIARSVRLPVKSTGVLFFLIVPIGAFVEIDEKLIQKTRFRDSGRIMAGGPGSNIIVALVALALLLLLVGGLVPTQFRGVYVGTIVQNSPADALHHSGVLQAGDLIVSANGTAVHSEQELHSILVQTKPNETLLLTIDHGGADTTYPLKLAANPSNTSIGFIGIQEAVSTSNLVTIKRIYSSSFFSNPLIYLVVPGIYPNAETVLPFSNTLHPLYISPTLGPAWYPIALTLFWIWFINVNLAFFNAIPLYPLDGGQALLNFFSHFGKKWVEIRAKALTTAISVVMFILILAFLFVPRLLAFVNT